MSRKNQVKDEDKIMVSPVKTFSHQTAGTLLKGENYPLDPRIANRLLNAGMVNPSVAGAEPYSTKVITPQPVLGNAQDPSSEDGGASKSSASQVVQASAAKTANKSGAGGKSTRKGGK